MIIEFLTMKITFDAILDHVNNLGQQHEIQERVRFLKAKLLRLTADLQSGIVGSEEFKKQESEIMKEIDSLIKQITSGEGSNHTTTSSDASLGGLTGLL